jgi:flavin-dependent dehydrogenase
MRKVDIVVLGAGVSGCVAAALLAKRGYQVAMISKDAGTAHHLPESWFYNSPSSIQTLRIEEQILSTLRKQTSCTFCSSDHQHSIEISIKDMAETHQNHLMWVDRNRLDRVLLKTALEQGVAFQPLSRITHCQITDEEVLICIEASNEKHELTASYLIDATGKMAFLSQHLHLPVEEKKLDARVAYFSHFERPGPISEGMKIFSLNGGYLFYIPVSDKRVSIGCVLAEDRINPKQSPEEIFNVAVASSSYLSRFIEHASRVLPIIPAKNSQRICLEPAGLRYRLVGDAAAFLDPFFCPGIDFAFFSAEQAVATIENGTAQDHTAALKTWLETSRLNVFENMERSDWQGVLRLFADPHLPFVVPVMLTQAFGQLRKEDFSFKNGIDLAREAYEMAPC